MTQTIATIADILVGVLIVGGAVLSMISSFGLLRLPDFYTRSHAVGKTTTLGVLLVLIGAFVFFIFDSGHVDAKLVLGILFVFITAPLSSHLIGRAAYRSGVKLWEHSTQDRLGEALKRRQRSSHHPSQGGSGSSN